MAITKWTSLVSVNCSRSFNGVTCPSTITDICGRTLSPSHNLSFTPGCTASSDSKASRTVAPDTVTELLPPVSSRRGVGMKRVGIGWGCVTLSGAKSLYFRGRGSSLTLRTAHYSFPSFISLSMFCGGANHSADKSFHVGFIESINAIFFALNQPLICFSRAIAAWMSDVDS